VLDIGTGTGVLPRNLYKYGAEFIGADISENQINEARRLSEGMNISYVVSPAETVDFPDEYFDVVTACQCYVYFDKDVLFPKIYKLLKNEGHFCILFMAWLPDESRWSAHEMKRFVYDFPEQDEGLFEVENSLCYGVSLPFTRESWHGRMKACRGIGASSLSAEE